MSVYVGIDVHRKRSQVAVIDANGNRVWVIYTDIRRWMRLRMRLRSLAGPSQTHDRASVLPGQRWRRIGDSNS
jgi:hypothetical protein